jgi:uncharacterized protein
VWLVGVKLILIFLKMVKTLNLYLTKKCNLNCNYCFVDKNNEELDFETAKAVLNFMVHEWNNEELKVSFFGGEPLLMFNLIKQIVNFSNSEYNKKIRFGLNTNGTLFNEEIANFFWDNDIQILFSWDGTKERIEQVKGKQGYKKMLSSVNLLKKKGFNLFARATISPADIDLVQHVNHIREVGFSDYVLAKEH